MTRTLRCKSVQIRPNLHLWQLLLYTNQTKPKKYANIIRLSLPEETTTTATTTTTTATIPPASYQVLLAPPAGTTTVDNTHNIALRLFNHDTSSPIQYIDFGAPHCDSDILFARTHPDERFDMGGHTTKNPGLYSSADGALIEEHLVSVTTFSLLDLFSRPEGQLPRGFHGAPWDQWVASFVVVEAPAKATARQHSNNNNAQTLRVRSASPFAISQGKYLEAEYTLHALHFGYGEDNNNKDKKK
jgi:hypothetical protein